MVNMIVSRGIKYWIHPSFVLYGCWYTFFLFLLLYSGVHDPLSDVTMPLFHQIVACDPATFSHTSTSYYTTQLDATRLPLIVATIDVLSYEILINIFCCLTTVDIGSVSRVSQRWHEICEPVLYRETHPSDYAHIPTAIELFLRTVLAPVVSGLPLMSVFSTSSDWMTRSF